MARRPMTKTRECITPCHGGEAAERTSCDVRSARSSDVCDLRIIYYGSFCNRVRMFCGMVLAWATIAVLACCRIWALDSCEVACA